MGCSREDRLVLISCLTAQEGPVLLNPGQGMRGTMDSRGSFLTSLAVRMGTAAGRPGGEGLKQAKKG